MRFPILAFAAVAAVALTASSAKAEVLRVPFSFSVGNKVLPAGSYTVQRDETMHMVTLRSNDSSSIFGWVVGPGDPDPSARGVVLKFDESPSGFALRSIQYNSDITSRLDKKSQSDDRRVHTLRAE